MTESSTATAGEVLAALHELADPKRAATAAWFFKSGPGEYGEGDSFLGIRVPQTRTVVKRFRYLEPGELFDLAHSPFHEVRLCALLILVEQFRRAKRQTERAELFEHFMRLLDEGVVNNWDLIDSTAPYFGAYLIDRADTIDFLTDLAKSESLWRRRAALIFTFAFIRVGKFEPTIAMANLLLQDKHDLIHKAVGWMLREAGNRDLTVLRAFLKQHAGTMPRTMLRYAIEKLSAEERAQWLAVKANLAKTT